MPFILFESIYIKEEDSMKKGLFFILGLLFAWNISSGPAGRESVWKEFLATEGRTWRPHFTDRGSLKSIYGVGLRKFSSSDEAATLILQHYGTLFGVERLSDLRLREIERSPIGTHYYYQQYYSGFPVVGGEVAIHLNTRNQLMAASSNYQEGLRGGLQYRAAPEKAIASALKFFGRNSGFASQPELMVLPVPNGATLVWKIAVDSSKLSQGSWIFYADAENPSLILRATKTYASFEGRGSIFLENPVTTPSRSVQTFSNLDGSKSLSGRFAKAFDANSQHDVSSPLNTNEFTTASDAGRRYNYNQTDARFTEAMAYFHINRVHDRWGSFGFNKLNGRAPVFVNVTSSDGGRGLDNAFYTRNRRFKTGIYVFGAGDHLENLGVDADVYYHEYGHGVLDHSKPGLFEAIESNYPGSFHEGFGDISDAAITGNPKIGEFGLRLKSNKKFIGRNIENQNRFPENVALPRGRKSEVHHTGLIVGGTWWDLRQAIGSDQAQQILFRSIALLPNEMDFFDLRDAMLTADFNSSGGVNRLAIENAFNAHGLGGEDPGQPGSLTMTSLKTAIQNPNTGSLIFKSTFQKGDTILFVASYRASRLTPGYNMIPVRGALKGPVNSSLTVFGLIDEVVNGTRTGRNGAVQAILFSDENANAGSYSLNLQSRLGGTGKTSPQKTAKFKIQ
jgi:Zn-dependent metalloprotease